jgi:ribosomal protein S18 acetylase RimI-like enzyme
VAVLYVGYNYDSFSFDVVVHENHRRKGLARKLVQIAVKQFEQMKNAFGEDFHMKVYVVNPDMERLLKSMGFNVEKRMERNNTLMTMESSIMQALREMTVSGCKKKKMIFRDN